MGVEKERIKRNSGPINKRGREKMSILLNICLLNEFLKSKGEILRNINV